MNVYVKDSRISADLSTLSATRKAQKDKKFFVDLLMYINSVVKIYNKRFTPTIAKTTLPIWTV